MKKILLTTQKKALKKIDFALISFDPHTGKSIVVTITKIKILFIH